MSDSTIDDALRLLEIGKGNKERLNKIIEGFEKRSLIPLQDRKYVEALVQQYLTPRHRIKIKKSLFIKSCYRKIFKKNNYFNTFIKTCNYSDFNFVSNAYRIIMQTYYNMII